MNTKKTYLQAKAFLVLFQRNSSLRKFAKKNNVAAQNFSSALNGTKPIGNKIAKMIAHLIGVDIGIVEIAGGRLPDKYKNMCTYHPEEVFFLLEKLYKVYYEKKI